MQVAIFLDREKGLPTIKASTYKAEEKLGIARNRKLLTSTSVKLTELDVNEP